MRRRLAWAGVAAFTVGLLGSSTAWTAQQRISPAEAMAKSIAQIKSIGILANFKDELTVFAPKNVCAEVEALGEWDFKKQVEEHANRALSERFTVSTKAFEDWAARRVGTGGRSPKNTLPPGGDVDAFIILKGSVGFAHRAGLPTPDMAGPLGGPIPALLSKSMTTDDPEIEWVSVNAEIVETKTKARRTIAYLQHRVNFSYTREGMLDFSRPTWKVTGPGAKLRTDKVEWMCGNPLTDERKRELQNDYRLLIQDALDNVFQTLTLADTTLSTGP